MFDEINIIFIPNNWTYDILSQINVFMYMSVTDNCIDHACAKYKIKCNSDCMIREVLLA